MAGLKRSGSGGFSSRSRAGLYLQVGATIALAAAAALLLGEVAGLRGLRYQRDLSSQQRNTLSEAVLDQIQKLPAPVTIDVFFRPQPGEWAAATADAQQRTRELLLIAANGSQGKLVVVENDLGDLAAIEEKKRALKQSDPVNKLVLTLGARHIPLSLYTDLGEYAPDPADPRKPLLGRFKGEEALANALARLAAEGSPKLVFAQSHGELALADDGPMGLAALQQALADEGYATQSWRGGALPADTAVVALLAPTQPFAAAELETLGAFVAKGGRLLAVAPSHPFDTGRGSLADFLAQYGMRALAGLVCQQVYDPVSGVLVSGVPQCAQLVLDSGCFDRTHPLTKPFVRFDRRLAAVDAHAFERAQVPPKTVLRALVRSPKDCWLDLPSGAGANGDYLWDRESEGEVGVKDLVLAAEIEAEPAPAPATADPARRARVLAVGASSLFVNAGFATNRDFAVGAFQWLANRESRLVVASRDPSQGRIDLERGPYLRRTVWLGWYLLPGGCALIGLFVGWKRRRA